MMGSFVPKYVHLATPQLDERKQQVFDRLFSDALARTDSGIPLVQYTCPYPKHEFLHHLVEHHHAEEHDGLFQAILEVLPDSRAEVNRLVRQHEKMTDILELAKIHAQRGEPVEAEGLRVDMQKFLEMFRQHERDEDELLRRAHEREGKSVS